jgi:hypothetical protein
MVDGEYKVAQYGQWDGYPEGQGKTVLAFLRSLNNITKKKFIEKCKAATWLTDEEETNLEKIIEKMDDKTFQKQYPQISRDTCAKILKVVAYKKKGIKLINKIDFVKDSLFCEWVYVIDFDLKTFEVFRGFNQTPLNNDERFSTFSDIVKQEYYPVKLFIKYDLNKLPTEKKFLDDCKKLLDKEKN